MNFTMDRRQLIKMLSIVCTKPGLAPFQKKDDLLRIEASDGVLKLLANEALAEAEATIHHEGVCFLRYKKLLPLIRSFKGTKEITIEITPQGLQIDSLKISEGIWAAIFDDPASAPARLADDFRKEPASGLPVQTMLDLPQGANVPHERPKRQFRRW